MNRELLWPILGDTAVMDRISYVDAWSGASNPEATEGTNAEITRLHALNGKSFEERLH